MDVKLQGHVFISLGDAIQTTPIYQRHLGTFPNNGKNRKKIQLTKQNNNNKNKQTIKQYKMTKFLKAWSYHFVVTEKNYRQEPLRRVAIYSTGI